MRSLTLGDCCLDIPFDGRYPRVKGEDGMPNARNALVALVAFLTITGCVPGGALTDRHTVNPDQIAAIYVPTTKYDGYSCTQLAAEIQNTNAIIADMSVKLAKGEYDKSGGLVVTPLFLMYDNTSVNDETPKKSQELGRLKGILMSLKEASDKKRCAVAR